MIDFRMELLYLLLKHTIHLVACKRSCQKEIVITFQWRSSLNLQLFPLKLPVDMLFKASLLTTVSAACLSNCFMCIVLDDRWQDALTVVEPQLKDAAEILADVHEFGNIDSTTSTFCIG